MQKKRSTSLYIAAALLFFGGIGYLIFSGFSESGVYFLNVSEAKAAQPQQLKNVRLFGTVAKDEITKPEKGQGANFLLEDKDAPALTIPVAYKGTVPDAFKAGAEVIVEGGMGSDGKFRAKSLMTKCPSKYQKENRKN